MRIMQNRTKLMFANAIMDITTRKELSKIRVTELCEYCGTDRQTFYYHFKDKYDLVAWIYENDWKYSFDHYTKDFSKEQTYILLEQIKKKQFFYRKAFDDSNQNSLFSYMRDTNRRVTEDIVKRRFQISELNAEQRFAINYHAYAWVCCLSEWVANKCEPEPAIYVNFLHDNSVIIYEKHPFK